MIVALAVVLELFLSPQSAVARNGLDQAEVASMATTVSFWGRPYPCGYTGWGPCVRYERLETARGITFRRVWICSRSGVYRRPI
jgi:hypothetical protein